MCSTRLSGVLWAGMALWLAPSLEGDEPSGFETIGVYTGVASIAPSAPFLKACGYNTLEFCDASTLIPSANLESYHARMQEGIQIAHRNGFKVYILLLSNVGPMRSPEQSLESLHFSPRDTKRMQQRFDAIANEVQLLREADGFEFLAGDPGGDPSRQADLRDCLAMSREVKAIVNRVAPKAEFIFNSWAIAAWDQWTSPFTVEFWEKEIDLTRRVLDEPGWIGPQVGMDFSMHNHYRSLALKCYADAGRSPRLFPSRAEVDKLRKRGVRRLWAWPYFLIDECDDGFTGRSWGEPQAETRYLHKLVGAARALGLNGLMGNLSSRSLPSEILNTYAFARFARDPECTPAQVIREFAALLVEDTFVADLADVLALVENRSTWQASLPPGDRLANLPTGDLDSPAKALARLSTLTVRKQGRIPMPGTPSGYPSRLATQLQVIASRPAP